MTRPPAPRARAASVATSAASLAGSRIAVALLALVFLAISARILSVEEMAAFAVYNIFTGLISVVGSLGLLAGAVRSLPGLTASGRDAEASAVARLATKVQLFAGGAWTAVLVLTAGPIAAWILEAPERAGNVRLSAVAALCFGLYEASQLLLNGLQRYERLASNYVVTALAQRALSLALFFLMGFPGYLAGFALGSLVGVAYAAPAIAGVMRARPETPPGWAASQIRYCMPFYADGYLRYLYMQADQVIVGVALNPTALAIYFIAKRCLQYSQLFVQSLLDPIGTRAAAMRETQPESIARFFARSRHMFLCLLIPVSIFLAAGSPLLLAIIGGERYAAAEIPLALLFLTMIPFALFSHLALFVFVLGRPRDRLATNLTATVGQLAPMLGLIPWLGLPALALARGIGFTAGSAHAGAVLARADESLGGIPGPRQGLRLREIAICTAASIAGGLIAALPWMMGLGATLIPVTAVPAAILVGVLIVRWAMDAEDRSALAGLIKGKGTVARFFRSPVP